MCVVAARHTGHSIGGPAGRSPLVLELCVHPSLLTTQPGARCSPLVPLQHPALKVDLCTDHGWSCSGGGRRRAQPRGAARGGGRTRGCGSPRPSRRAGREREAGRETQPEPSKSQRWSRPPRRAGLQLLTASGGEPCPCRRRRAALPGPGGSQRLGADPPGTARLGSARRRPGRGARRGAVRFGLARSGPDVIGSHCAS